MLFILVQWTNGYVSLSKLETARCLRAENQVCDRDEKNSRFSLKLGGEDVVN